MGLMDSFISAMKISEGNDDEMYEGIVSLPDSKIKMYIFSLQGWETSM